MPQVFISYSRRDLPFVEQLVKDLRNAGLEAWYDLSGLEGGQRWGSEIQDAIRKSQYFIVVLSPHSIASEWVEKEFMYAHNLGRRIVPILYQACETPMWVSNLHFINMQKGSYRANLAPLLGVLGVDTWMERKIPSSANERNDKKNPSLRNRRRTLFTFAIGGSVFLALLVAAGLLWGDNLAASLFAAKTFTSTITSTSTHSQSSTFTPSMTFSPTLGIGSSTERHSDGMTMVYVPAGEFTMGSAEGVPQDQPPHPVFLDAYWIDQVEVTNDMYALCVNAGICDMPHRVDSETRTSYFGNSDFADFPVIAVDWEDSKRYCEWAGGRLPTEAEWEKAARGTFESTFPWGDNAPDCTLENYWVGPSCAGDTARVGSYPSGASPYGTLDQAGNAMEWVADFLGTYPATLVRNPTGPASGENHVARGGSFKNYNWFTSSYHRFGYIPGTWSLVLGFRCANSIP